jgi:hypothetical protein
MKDTLGIRFNGKSKPRNIFLRDFREQLIEFMGGLDNYSTIPFVMFCNEIVKNIYDHANGLGWGTFRREGNKIFFEIGDHGIESFDLEEIKKLGSTKIGNGINFRAGLCGDMIVDMAKTLKIKLEIITLKGFRYNGIFNEEFRV